MILNFMLGTGYGGLEKLFLDELEMLPMAGMAARGVVCRNSQLASFARKRNLEFDQIAALSDWDPISVARARLLLRRRQPGLVMCVGRRAHRLLARSVRPGTPIVPMVQKRNFDRSLPYAGVLVAAEHRRRTLIQDGVSSNDIVVIPNAVRLPAQPKDNYRTDAGAGLRIAALGRLHEKKGFEVLVSAVGRLIASGIDCTCDIAGEGPERAALGARIERDGLGSKVSLSGWTDRVAEFLSKADVFVLPSLQEDFPLAVLDAMASGLPIVASAIEGPSEFLADGETALLVPPSEPQALANALIRLGGDPVLREKLGRMARNVAVQNYSFDAIGRRLAVALQNVLAGRRISGIT